MESDSSHLASTTRRLRIVVAIKTARDLKIFFKPFRSQLFHVSLTQSVTASILDKRKSRGRQQARVWNRTPRPKVRELDWRSK